MVAEREGWGRARAWWLGSGLLVGLLLVYSGQKTVHYTSTDAFCEQACHSHPHATASWIASAHYANARGITAHCADCHLPPEGLPYLFEKARLGLHDAYAQLFRDVSKIDWASKRQLARAREFTYDSACIHCHSDLFRAGLSQVPGTLPPGLQQSNALQIEEMRIVARRMEAHLYYQRNRERMRCVNCHLEDGHRMAKAVLPGGPAREDAEFPLRPEGFQNYTEVLPGSDLKFHMIAVPEGGLERGSPELGACRERDSGPAERVRIAPFWMAETTVSRPELDWFLTQTKERAAASELTERVVTAYAEWLSRTTKKKYRLPSEVELEYACLAGGTMPPWRKTVSRALPETRELNAWGFLDLPDRNREFAEGSSENLPRAWWQSDQIGMRFRLVREKEGTP